MKKARVLKPFQYVLNEDNGTPEKGCVLVCMHGHCRMQDFYLCIPEEGFYYRAANNVRYGDWKYEYFIDGSFVGAGRKDKMARARKLYDAGEVYEAEQYILGHMLWRETSLGGKHINERKEAARISHALCDVGGKAGHNARQWIRRSILHGARF